MVRKLILTPFDHGGLSAIDSLFNESPLADNHNPLDIGHLVLSVVTMSGVDSIHSFEKLSNSQTTLVEKVLPKTSLQEWLKCWNHVHDVFDNYYSPNLDKEIRWEIEKVSNKVSQLFYAMKTNSGILVLFDLKKLDNNLLPPELLFPTEILFSSIQTKIANLPVVRHDIQKRDIKRLLEVLAGKEFKTYQEAQSEVELNQNLTTKTINRIEKAGKELYNKNVSLLNIKENAIKAIPISSKVIDLFFGKLPGILTEYAGNILTDYLKLNKSIPLYSCDAIIKRIIKSRVGIKD